MLDYVAFQETADVPFVDVIYDWGIDIWQKSTQVWHLFNNDEWYKVKIYSQEIYHEYTWLIDETTLIIREWDECIHKESHYWKDAFKLSDDDLIWIAIDIINDIEKASRPKN